MKKTQTIKFGDFMSGNWEKAKLEKAKLEKAKIIGASIPVIIGPSIRTYAMTNSEMIMHGLDPLIHFIMDLAYPIAGVMIAGGCLMIMIGGNYREKGIDMIKNAGIGYFLVQLSPLFLKILVQLGANVLTK